MNEGETEGGKDGSVGVFIGVMRREINKRREKKLRGFKSSIAAAIKEAFKESV